MTFERNPRRRLQLSLDKVIKSLKKQAHILLFFVNMAIDYREKKTIIGYSKREKGMNYEIRK